MNRRSKFETFNKPILLVAILIHLTIPSCKLGNRGIEEKLGVDELITGFQNPPISARPKGFWVWPKGNFDLDRLTFELEDSKEKGMGGYDIWDVDNLRDIENKVPAGPPFMGEESVNAIVHAIKEATRLEMELGLVVASSWNSGGSWIKPEHGVMGLLDTTIVVEGPQNLRIKFPFPKLPVVDGYGSKTLVEKDANGLPTFFREVALLAIPAGDVIIGPTQLLDLSENFRNGTLTCEIPTGKWEITRYVVTGLGTPLKRPSPNSNGRMIDHFSKEAQHAHLSFFIEKLQPHFEDLGKTALKYLYNDSYEVKGSVWTPKLVEEFKLRIGYDPIPYLPILKGKLIDNEEISGRFLYDFKKLLSDLAIDNHYKYGTEFCGQFGLAFHAEGGGPGPPLHEVPVESIKALGALSVPRGEFWHKDDLIDDEGFNSHWFVKGIASSAHLYNQPFVEAEAFTSRIHWQEGWQDFKPTADQAFCEGLNRVVFHTSNHSPDKFGKPGYVYGFGSHFDTRQTWWPKARAWNDYLARCSYLLQQGNFVGDILYYYGDQAPNFPKQRHIKEGLGFGYDYDEINTEKLLELVVLNGKMTLPHDQKYSLLVIPVQETMPLNVLKKIEWLLNQGAIVIGQKPQRTPGLFDYENKDSELETIASKLWSNLRPDSKEGKQIGAGWLYTNATQRNVLYAHAVYPDFYFKGQDDSTSLNFIHRKTEKEEIYFVRNINNRAESVEAVFRVKEKIPQVWIPETGKIVDHLIYRFEGDSIRLALSFEPYGSYFVVFRDINIPATHYNKIQRNEQVIFPSSNQYSQIDGYDLEKEYFKKAGKYIFSDAEGKNMNKIYHSPESLKIETDWEVQFQLNSGAPESIEMKTLYPWNDSEIPGVKYFSGIATYTADFSVETIKEGKYYLNLGEVRELADVWLNDVHLGIVWHKPFELGITEALRIGENVLKIEVANVWNNRLVGDDMIPDDERITNTNIVNGPIAWGSPWRDAPLKKSGLLGPVRISFYPKIK